MPIYKEDEPASDGVNLLISILVCYPEIGSIRFEPKKNVLQLTFLLSEIPSDENYTSLCYLLRNSIDAFHSLVGTSANIVDVQLSPFEPVVLLTITRDINTLFKGEINMLITLLRDHLKSRLLRDYNESMLEEDLRLQEDVIEDMLANIKKHQHEHRLIGIREDGRVMVFNK